MATQKARQRRARMRAKARASVKAGSQGRFRDDVHVNPAGLTRGPKHAADKQAAHMRKRTVRKSELPMPSSANGKRYGPDTERVVSMRTGKQATVETRATKLQSNPSVKRGGRRGVGVRSRGIGISGV